jgi:hypothetical protein
VEAVERGEVYQTLYNLKVSEYHTYFVGSEEWGFSVWSHNLNCTPEELTVELKRAKVIPEDARTGRPTNAVRAALAGDEVALLTYLKKTYPDANHGDLQVIAARIAAGDHRRLPVVGEVLGTDGRPISRVPTDRSSPMDLDVSGRPEIIQRLVIEYQRRTNAYLAEAGPRTVVEAAPLESQRRAAVRAENLRAERAGTPYTPLEEVKGGWVLGHVPDPALSNSGAALHGWLWWPRTANSIAGGGLQPGRVVSVITVNGEIR